MSARHPKIYNLTLTSADTEYSQALPMRTKRMTVQARNDHAVRMAFETGKVATPTAPYWSINSAMTWYDSDLNFDGRLYFASADAGTVVEIMIWDE